MAKKTPAAAITTVYTFAVIDMDLLRDDVSSASGVLPALFWLSREEAQAALVLELRTRWDDDGPGADNPEAGMPPVVFTENEHDEGGLTAQVEWLGEDAEVYVYALKLGQ